MSVTVEQYLRKKHPELMKEVDEHGCWDFKVTGPSSLDDYLVVRVRIYIGKKKSEKIKEVTIEFPLAC